MLKLLFFCSSRRCRQSCSFSVSLRRRFFRGLSSCSIAIAHSPFHPDGAIGYLAYAGQQIQDGVRRTDTFKPLSRETRSEAKHVGDDLDAVENAIRRRGNDPEVVPNIVAAIQKMKPQTDALKKKVEDLRVLNERVQRFDTTLLSRKSRERLKSLDPEDQKRVEKEMRDEMKRIDMEKKLTQIEETLSHQLASLPRYLGEAVNLLQTGQKQSALRAIRLAKGSQRSILELADLVKKLEDYLLALLRSDIKIEKGFTRS